MDLVILGFLMIRTLSQYDLLKAIDRDLTPYYSKSLGSIQSTLKRLEQKGLVSVVKGMENNRKKNSYSITKAGVTYFKELMKRDFTDSKFDAESGTRMFFMGLLNDLDIEYVLQKMIDFTDEKLKLFKEENKAAKDKVIPAQYQKVVTYQLNCLNYGIAQYKVSNKHFKKLLKELKEKSNEI
jgi:DNA-binding PadR family transcriptional regulator